MKILFVNLSALRFTTATVETEPLGGSESALCYLACALAARGHDVSLSAHLPPRATDVIKGVRHFPLDVLRDASFFSAQRFDAIILCNAPAAAALIKAVSPRSRVIVWVHILPDQPALQGLAQAETQSSLYGIAYVSQWQREQVERVFGAGVRSCVLGNGIAPAFENMFANPKEILAIKAKRAAYTATPFRGLDVLVRAMQGFDESVKLDLFSSMKLYQTHDDAYTSLFASALQNPSITHHGAVAQGDLAASLRKSAFLFYPCIYPETFCITVAEAMAAGLHVVTTDIGALRETSLGFYDLVPIISSEGEVLVRTFRAAMLGAVAAYQNSPEAWAERAFAQSQSANRAYNWSMRAKEWEQFLGSPA